MRLKNKVAVVTGGAQGIGAGIATRFAEEGASVVIADVNEEASKDRVVQIEAAGGTAIYVLCDVSDQGQVANLFQKAKEAYGQVDILVNNAALVHHPGSNVNFLELSAESWLRALEINLTGMFYCSQAAARMMVKQDPDERGVRGCIINIGSGGGSRAHRHLFNYDTTKGGIEAATRAMALDLAPWKVRVNTLVPGNITVDNSLGGATGPEAAQRTIPLGHSGSPADLGAVAAFLASDDAAYITGERLIVDGGMNAQLRSPAVDVQIDPDLPDRI